MLSRTLLFCVLFSLFITTKTLFAAPSSKTSRLIPSQYIIVLKDNIDVDDISNKFLRRFSALQINHRYRHALKGLSVKIPPQFINQIKSDPGVAYIEQDTLVTLNAQNLPTGINRINADIDATANIDGIDDRVDVDIAILDTGIDLDHPDLNVFSYAYCKTQGPVNANCMNNDSSANDVHGHGTHVAGIAAALDNNTGVVGVAPGARLWAIKVLEDSGTGAGSQILAGVDYVTQHADEIEVANMSLTGDGDFQSLTDAIDGAISAGIVFTLAAGNDHKDVSLVFPAGHANAITVSAFEDYDGIPGGLSGSAGDDTFANFSNYGSGVTIMAPGTSILSTVVGGGTGYNSGTSMASPHVAGAAALYLNQNPSAGPATVKATLISTGDPAPCSNNGNGICGSPEDPDGIQEPLLFLGCSDADGDGVCDSEDNCPATSNTDQLNNDNDTQGNACDLDDDNDSLNDADETIWLTDPFNPDSDSDGLTDGEEVNTHSTSPTNPDSDNDGLSDGDEIIYGYDPLQSSKGDIAPRNLHDNTLNSADLLILTQVINGQIIASDVEITLADMNDDGFLNIVDILLLSKILQ